MIKRLFATLAVLSMASPAMAEPPSMDEYLNRSSQVFCNLMSEGDSLAGAYGESIGSTFAYYGDMPDEMNIFSDKFDSSGIKVRYTYLYFVANYCPQHVTDLNNMFLGN